MSPDPFTSLTDQLAAPHAALVTHPLYATLGDRGRLRRFMETHVFAVWDFMSLLKTLQARLTSVSVPWTPPRDRLAARLINEIVLGEETDEIAPGVYQSHFELYLEAMEEVGARTDDARALVEALRDGGTLDDALSASTSALPHAQRFVRQTMLQTQGSTISVAASFLLGRERLVPAMFETMLAGLADTPCPRLRLYLHRHIELDGGDHGPKAEALLRALCGSSAAAWREAQEAAHQALIERQRLWDAVLAASSTS